MLRLRKILVTLVMFVALCLSTAAIAKAEHIFFEVFINGVPVSDSPSNESPQSILGDGSVIISPTGTFTFTFRVFNVNNTRFGDGGILDVAFLVDPTSTLPPPMARSFLYDGTGTRTQPVIFSFTEQYGTGGILSGSIRTTLTSFATPRGPGETEIRTLPFTAVSTIPEPTTVLLLGTGLAGVAAGARRRRTNPKK